MITLKLYSNRKLCSNEGDCTHHTPLDTSEAKYSIIQTTTGTAESDIMMGSGMYFIFYTSQIHIYSVELHFTITDKSITAVLKFLNVRSMLNDSPPFVAAFSSLRITV